MKKKVVLLGDSIRLIGYGTVLPELIKEDFDVFQSDDNSRFVQYLLRQLFELSDEIDKADIVHFNSGEWDVSDLFGDGSLTEIDYYTSQTKRIAELLLKKGKTVIFATTTPVREGHIHNSNSDIARYNERAVNALKPLGVTINDLYSVVMKDLNGNIREDDGIHLTEKGIMLCAQATADVLKAFK